VVLAFASSSREIKYVIHQVGVKRTSHLETFFLCVCVCVCVCVYVCVCVCVYIYICVCVCDYYYDDFYFYHIFFILRVDIFHLLFTLIFLFLVLLPNSTVIPAMTFIVTLWAWESAQWAVTSYNSYGKISCQIKPTYRS
jgi:hypothetical protein